MFLWTPAKVHGLPAHRALSGPQQGTTLVVRVILLEISLLKSYVI